MLKLAHSDNPEVTVQLQKIRQLFVSEILQQFKKLNTNLANAVNKQPYEYVIVDDEHGTRLLDQHLSMMINYVGLINSKNNAVKGSIVSQIKQLQTSTLNSQEVLYYCLNYFNEVDAFVSVIHLEYGTKDLDNNLKRTVNRLCLLKQFHAVAEKFNFSTCEEVRLKTIWFIKNEVQDALS